MGGNFKWEQGMGTLQRIPILLFTRAHAAARMTLVVAILLSGSVSAQLPATIDLSQPPGSEGTPVTRMYGPSDSGGIGSGIDGTFGGQGRYGDGGTVYGDFNGDGLADIALGGHDAIHPTFTDYPNDTGCVYIRFGTAGGGVQALTFAPGMAGPGEARIFGGGDENLQLGRSLAAGNFNGDGYDDLLLGAFVNAATPCGGQPLYIMYGSASLAGQTYLLPLDDLEFQTNGVPDYLAVACYTGPMDYMGLTLAVGDFDGDGRDDFVAGYGDTGSQANFVVFGSTLDPGGATSLDELLSNNAQINGGGHVGYTLASGDINGDGFDDIVLGDAQSISSAAWDAYIVYGQANLMGNSFALGVSPTSGTTRILGGSSSSTGPSYVVANDVDGDGLDDIVVSSESDDIRTITVVYGSDILGNALVDLSDPGQAMSSTRYTNDTLVQNSASGYPYIPEMGDANGDGFSDMLLGVPEVDVSDAWPAGRAFILYGGPGLRATTSVLTAPEGNVHVISASTGVDEFGISPSAGGDFNGDGFADFTLAAPLGVTSSTTSGGYAIQVYGAGTAPSASATEGFRAGNAPARDFGGRMSPVLRTRLAFTGGNTAPATATLTRNLDAIGNFDEPDMLANVTWELGTTRTSWSSAEVTFRYLDTEVAGLIESALVLYHAPDPSGPWTEVAVQSRSIGRNEITATVDSFSHFVIAQKGTGLPAVGSATLMLLCGLLGALGLRKMRGRGQE